MPMSHGDTLSETVRANHPYRVEWRERRDKPGAEFSEWQPVFPFGVMVLDIHLAEALIKTLYPGLMASGVDRWDGCKAFMTHHGMIIELRDEYGRAKGAADPAIEGY